MARGLGLALALLLLSAPAASALTGPSGELVAGSEGTVLRLHDLPPGYQIGDDTVCGPIIPGEGTPKRLRRWLVKYWPEGCTYQYEQVFEVPGFGPAPPEVAASTLNTPSKEAASNGFKLLNQLITRFEKGGSRRMVGIPPGGTPARLMRSENFLVEGKKDQPGSFVLWHHGKLIASVSAAGMNPRRNDQAALGFAEIQQRRLEAPSLYAEAEQEDTEVQLDDPGLKFPVYWVGNPFEPPGGPASELVYAYADNLVPPGEKFELEYDEFHVDGWTRRSWKRFQPTVLGRRNLKRACVRKTEVPLERGSAVVYAGYSRRDLRSCPRWDTTSGRPSVAVGVRQPVEERVR